MTSQDRRNARYMRRKAKRESKRLDCLKNHGFDQVSDVDNLYKSMLKARNGVWWKASVQRYDMNYLRRIIQTRKELKAGKDIRKGFYEFYSTERGKKRFIQSVQFRERVVQKSFCMNALTPILERTLIHDNGASIENKGIHFAFNRLKVHLQKHYKEHGNNGYVLIIDFKNYFANINHETVLDIYTRQFGEDERLYRLAELFVKAFGDKGLGLGSEASQITAIAYANKADHYIKDFLRLNFARYMDDNYFIVATIEEVHKLIEILTAVYKSINIELCPKKINICKLSQGFTFMQAKVSMSDTGKITIRPSRKSITRQRRKLYKFKGLHDKGQMTEEQAYSSYMSWHGYICYFKSRKSVHNMDKIYNKLFKENHHG